MKVCFICRGYPGLGKVVGVVAIDSMLREVYANYQSIFLTYYAGYEFLKSLDYQVIDILEGNLQIGQSSFCTPFGLETRNCVKVIEEFQPELIINDGEPYLIEVTSEILQLPTIVLAHPADLHSSTNSDLAINLFRYYYSKAALVIAHGLDKLPAGRAWLGNKTGQVVETNTIIRDPIYRQTLEQKSAIATSPFVVGVLGGGSKNVSSLFQEGTKTLGEWTIKACNELNVKRATLYCADSSIYSNLKQVESDRTMLSLVSEPRDNSEDMIQADVVVGRAGRNLLSEMIALGKKGIVVPVYAEKFRGGNQVRTAERAIQLNSNLMLSLLDDGYKNFRSKLQKVIEAPMQAVQWRAGNSEALIAIQKYCASSLNLLKSN